MKQILVFLVLLSGGLGGTPPNSQFAMNRLPKSGATLRTSEGKLTWKERLGSGSYGYVYEAVLVTRKGEAMPAAVKIEKPRPGPPDQFLGPTIPVGYSTLVHEYYMMDMMSTTRGFPDVYAANFDGKYHYYVMELLGKTVGQIRKESDGGIIPSPRLASMALQMLDRLEALHEGGYLMYDIHEHNFMFDKKDKILYAIDLGLAFPYRDSQGYHIPYGYSHLPQGVMSQKFSSAGDSEGHAVSRKDELERFLHLVVFLGTGKLPWLKLKSFDRRISKWHTSAKDVCTEKLAWLAPALRYVRKLNFEEDPDYDFIRGIFKKHIKSAKS